MFFVLKMSFLLLDVFNQIKWHYCVRSSKNFLWNAWNCTRSGSPLVAYSWIGYRTFSQLRLWSLLFKFVWRPDKTFVKGKCVSRRLFLYLSINFSSFNKKSLRFLIQQESCLLNNCIFHKFYLDNWTHFSVYLMLATQCFIFSLTQMTKKESILSQQNLEF